MSTHHEFYLERAAEARRDAASTALQNVRDRCLRAHHRYDTGRTKGTFEDSPYGTRP